MVGSVRATKPDYMKLEAAVSAAVESVPVSVWIRGDRTLDCLSRLDSCK